MTLPARCRVSCMVLILGLAAACRNPDPLAERLAVRTLYSISVISFSQKEGDKLLAELEVKSSMGASLSLLTATIRQHDAEGQVLSHDRVPLDLSDMDATGVLRLIITVPRYSEDVEMLSALVEASPPESEYAEFPEISAVASTE